MVKDTETDSSEEESKKISCSSSGGDEAMEGERSSRRGAGGRSPSALSVVSMTA